MQSGRCHPLGLLAASCWNSETASLWLSSVSTPKSARNTLCGVSMFSPMVPLQYAVRLLSWAAS